MVCAVNSTFQCVGIDPLPHSPLPRDLGENRSKKGLDMVFVGYGGRTGRRLSACVQSGRALEWTKWK